MFTHEDVRRAVGRRSFTARELADRLGVAPDQARNVVQRLIRQGRALRTDELAQYVGPDGRPTRGRPQHVYRLR
jgi:predicted ArsR family transcriptional regulator